jgi:hypothetical protein
LIYIDAKHGVPTAARTGLAAGLIAPKQAGSSIGTSPKRRSANPVFKKLRKIVFLLVLGQFDR